MLDNKQIRMLELLDDNMSKCKRCKLYTGGNVTPFWTSLSKYVIITDGPNTEEVMNNEAFINNVGNLWNIMGEFGFRKEEFLIINSTQCSSANFRILDKRINSKICKKTWKKYIKIIRPYRIITFGGLARGLLDGVYNVRSHESGHVYYCREFNVNYLISIHPKLNNNKVLRKSIKKFRKIGSEDV